MKKAGILRTISRAAQLFFTGLTLLIVVLLVYLAGFLQGRLKTSEYYEKEIAKIFGDSEKVSSLQPSANPSPNSGAPKLPSGNFNWSGPDLWEAVNSKRKQYGVNPLANRAELCTIASIRLNEILELGKLDGHEGFSNLPERRPDLAWIFEKYSLSEFLVSGAGSAEEAVSLWDNTLGHKKLLTGGEYVWGCTYAQEGFGVAIAAF